MKGAQAPNDEVEDLQRSSEVPGRPRHKTVMKYEGIATTPAITVNRFGSTLAQADEQRVGVGARHVEA